MRIKWKECCFRYLRAISLWLFHIFVFLCVSYRWPKIRCVSIKAQSLNANACEMRTHRGRRVRSSEAGSFKCQCLSVFRCQYFGLCCAAIKNICFHRYEYIYILHILIRPNPLGTYSFRCHKESFYFLRYCKPDSIAHVGLSLLHTTVLRSLRVQRHLLGLLQFNSSSLRCRAILSSE